MIHATADGDLRAIPRIIWALWLQGWDAAPEVVNACRTTWEALNPSWDFRPLTRNTIGTYLREDDLPPLHEWDTTPPEAFSDIVRIRLLRRYGGVWADATTYCLTPLDAWIDGDAAATGFVAFANPGPDRMLSSWFLAARRGNELVRSWDDATRAYWSGRAARDEYFWFHKLFARCYTACPHVRAIWDGSPRRDATACFQEPYRTWLWDKLPGGGSTVLGQSNAPLLKLTHRLPAGPYERDSGLRYLCDRASTLRFARSAL